MKARTFGIVAAAGLAGLVGCKVKHQACQPYYDRGYAAGLQEGLAQCPKQEEQTLPEEQIPPQPQERIWTEVLEDIYFLNDKPGNELSDAIFTDGHDVVNLYSLWVKDTGDVYVDYGRDGVADEIGTSMGRIYRGSPDSSDERFILDYRKTNEEEIFRIADEALAQAKKEIGLED